jgi:hypothetical protein
METPSLKEEMCRVFMFFCSLLFLRYRNLVNIRGVISMRRECSERTRCRLEGGGGGGIGILKKNKELA